MNYATMWFLVQIGSAQYIGPMPQQSCQQAAASLAGDGIVCRQPSYLMACDVTGRPGAYTTCPVFDSPQVTVKPKP
jgi:hypothetical protein